MGHIIIGTAGHVDHGKTALVRRLTGIDTDRLREEKARGLSIDLGFAYFDLPAGQRAGIVDVPGHERFIKNMLAGATSMDLVLLVVAADEGVMPQTREHLNIIHLLGASAGILVLTKTDLVEAEWLDLVEEEVRKAVEGTIYQKAPCVRVSSATGEGFDELVRAIQQVAATIPPRDTSGPPRLWVDRVFTIQGFGTIATGTLSRGTLTLDEEVQILPGRHLARIRSIEVHGEPVESVTAAQRVALNLARVEKQDLRRGDVIARPGSMRPTFMLDVRLRLLPDAPAALRNRDRLRVHIGTAEIMARAYLLDADELAPGQDCLAQLRLESPTTASRGDRLVLRRYSPMTTIAGGVVIDPAPRRHRRHDPATVERLAIAEQGNPAEILLRLLSEAGARGRAVDELARTLQWEPDRTRRMVDRLAAEGPVRVIQDGKVAVAAEAFDDLIARVLQVVGDYHAHNPLRPAMPKNALRNAAGHADAAVLDEAVAELERRGDVVVDARGVRLAHHRVRLSDRQQRLIHDIEARARRARFAPPRLEELLGLDAEAPEMVSVCLDGGALVDVEGFLFHADTIAEAKDIILAHTAQHGSLTVSQFRDLTRSTRKYAIPLLTYLDRIGFTRRDGDLRYLAQPPEDPPDNAGDPE